MSASEWSQSEYLRCVIAHLALAQLRFYHTPQHCRAIILLGGFVRSWLETLTSGEVTLLIADEAGFSRNVLLREELGNGTTVPSA
jgi:hypothetical protein